MQFHFKPSLEKKKKNRKLDLRHTLFLLLFANPNLIRIPLHLFLS